MIVYQDDCVGCRLPCLGDSCPNRNVPHRVCDCCVEEDQLYYFGDQELCAECILDRLEKVRP